MSLFFVSMEDDLMRLFGGERLKNMMERLGLPDDQPLEAKLVSRSIESAQKKIEGLNFDTRKNVLEFDDVLNHQRIIIYKRRKKYLQSHTVPTNSSEAVTGGVAILGAVSLSGLGEAVGQAAARNKDGALMQAFRLNLAWSGPFFLASVALSSYYFLSGNQFVGGSLLLVAFCQPIAASSSFFVSFLFGQKDFARGSLYMIAESSITRKMFPTLNAKKEKIENSATARMRRLIFERVKSIIVYHSRCGAVVVGV
jgi:hypothetical protein